VADPTGVAIDPPADQPRGAARFLQPRYVFPALLLLVVVTVLLTPVETARSGDPRLTSRSAESQGARGFYELAGRLGWHTTRRAIPFTKSATVASPRDSIGRASPGIETPLDSTAVYAVLDPPTDLSAAEAGAVLSAVRRGAGLLVVLSRGATLADSLALRPSLGGAAQVEADGPESPDSCAADASRKGAIDWPGGRVFSYWLVPRRPLPAGTVSFARVQREREPRARAAPDSASHDVAGLPRSSVAADSVTADSVTADSVTADSVAEHDTVTTTIRNRDTVAAPVVADSFDADDEDQPTFDPDTVPRVRFDADSAGVVVPVNAGARDAAGNRAAIVGFPLGAGRVVAIADPDWLRNDVLRVCSWNAGVQAARMLEYLAGRPAASRELVFDEYHQGFGRHPSTLRVIRRALLDHPLGRSTTQIAVAALVLIAAIGARGVSPRSAARLARRSPLEHVGALSRAYAQIGATRLVTRRLVRGIRRRHGGWGTALAGTPRSAGRSGESDDVFLAAVADRFPALAADVALLREASATQVTPERLIEVGRAADRVEHALGGGYAEPLSTPLPEPAR